MRSCYKKKIWVLIIIFVSMGLLKGEVLILQSDTVASSDCNAFIRNENVDIKELIEQIIEYKKTTCLNKINRLYESDEFKEKTELIYRALLGELFVKKNNELAGRVIELMPNKIFIEQGMFGVFSSIVNINTWELLYEKGFNPWREGDAKSFFDFMLEKNNIRKLKLSLMVARKKHILPKNLNKVLKSTSKKSLEINKILGLIND